MFFARVNILSLCASSLQQWLFQWRNEADNLKPSRKNQSAKTAHNTFLTHIAFHPFLEHNTDTILQSSFMAVELVVAPLVSSFFQVAFDRLASPDVFDFFRKRRLNEELLDKLKITLLSINTVVDDAEKKQISDPNVKDWLDMVKDAVYDAEDVLDEIDYEASKRKVEAEFQTTTSRKVLKFFTACVHSFDTEVETRMKQVLEKLEYLESRKAILKLQEGVGGAGSWSTVSERLPTTSLVDEDAIYGRDDDKTKIIEWLLSDNDSDQLSVISIVGMGGLGKTTLAQLVYNDKRVKDAFDLKAWTCVSDEFDVLRLTRTIVQSITMSTNDNTSDLNMLQTELKKLLSQKRFLLVLDDVWNENYMRWEALQAPFKYGALGSKILVTTRSGIVASNMRSSKIHVLQLLSEEESWSLFKRYAFRSADASRSNSHLEDIGREIMKKCKGLPLALKTIASLLYTKSSNEEWKVILKSGVWEEESNVLPALRLSYHYLPSSLKRCFAYCSLFPKDYEFDKELLIRLWMAENYLQCAHQSKDPRDVGEQFFHDLLSRSLFQRSTGDKTHFVMHDLVNDMAKYEAGKFFHRLEVDEANNLVEMTRHVSYLRNSYETSKRFEAIFRASRLRTFLPLSMQGHRLTNKCWPIRCMSSTMIHDLLSKFGCLRALSLSDYSELVELPDSVRNLKHLRYLDLSGTRIKKLPDSICELFHLQSLKLWQCWDLEKLPMDLHKLTNLRHLDFRKTKVSEMPKHLEKLKNLQVLSSFIVGKSRGTDIKQLKELNLRGKLSIGELQNVMNPSDALALNLKSKICIEELKLEWSMNRETTPNDKDILEKLQPHNNLKKLSISCYGGIAFPYWFVDGSLSNIVSLELSNCKNCASLPSLGLLLPSVEILRVIGMEALEEWKCENVSGAFSCLQEFSIEKCPKLKEHLPDELPLLRKLVIEDCEQLVASVPKAPCLRELFLRGCGKFQVECLPTTLEFLRIGGILPEIFSAENIDNAIANTCLEFLQINDCAHLELPLRHPHKYLVIMQIESSCNSLREFPLDLFPMLQQLQLLECSNLERISVSGETSLSLDYLFIAKCPKFESFPKEGFLAPKLDQLDIRNLGSLKSLPDCMNILFPSLEYLIIRNCPQVESFPEGGLPSTLKSFDIKKCPKLLAAGGLHSLASLESLTISDSDVESFPNEGLLPSSLVSLSIENCSNLRTLNHRGICHLNALEVLKLDDCPKLQKFPKEGLPNTLSTLSIEGCPLLKKRCQKSKGKDWDKISHIASIQIDSDIVT